MYYKIILVLVCIVYNAYSTNIDNIEIYKPYYQKLRTNNLQNNLSQSARNMILTNRLVDNSSFRTSSVQLSNYSYSQMSNFQSSVYNNSLTNNTQTNICNRTIASQNSISNIYNNSSSYTDSNNESIFINANSTEQEQSNISCNSRYINKQRNLIQLSIYFNNSTISWNN